MGIIWITDDCAKNSGEEFLPGCTALESRIFNDFIEIRLKSAMHLGKNPSPSSLTQSTIFRLLTELWVSFSEIAQNFGSYAGESFANG